MVTLIRNLWSLCCIDCSIKGNLKHICEKYLDKACFSHDAACSDSKDENDRLKNVEDKSQIKF